MVIMADPSPTSVRMSGQRDYNRGNRRVVASDKHRDPVRNSGCVDATGFFAGRLVFLCVSSFLTDVSNAKECVYVLQFCNVCLK